MELELLVLVVENCVTLLKLGNLECYIWIYGLLVRDILVSLCFEIKTTLSLNIQFRHQLGDSDFTVGDVSGAWKIRFPHVFIDNF